MLMTMPMFLCKATLPDSVHRVCTLSADWLKTLGVGHGSFVHASAGMLLSWPGCLKDSTQQGLVGTAIVYSALLALH